ncbi:MAG: hypothetical protein ACR2QF_12055, partial [Geminicoccaceae bacterium]
MAESLKISTNPIGPETLDFRSLFEAGLARAQDLSGKIWKDDNTHDPGITILESLVYALTDLAYRTDHSMAD